MLFATTITPSINARRFRRGGRHPRRGSRLRGGFGHGPGDNRDGIQQYPRDKFSVFDTSSGFDLDEMLLNLMGDDPKMEEIRKGRNGRGGPRSPFLGFSLDIEEYFTNIDCPSSSNEMDGGIVEEPDCHPIPAGHRPPSYLTTTEFGGGTWVCRTLYNPITGSSRNHSVCIDHEDGALASDHCGCCEPEGCPAPCECTCDDGEGVLVKFEKKGGPYGDDSIVLTKCIPPEVAVSKIASKNDRAMCDNSCNNLDNN